MSFASLVVSRFRHHTAGALRVTLFLLGAFVLFYILNWAMPRTMAGARAYLERLDDDVGNGIEAARPRSLAMVYHAHRRWLLTGDAQSFPPTPSWEEIESRLRNGLPWNRIVALADLSPAPRATALDPRSLYPGSPSDTARGLVRGFGDRLSILSEPLSAELVRVEYVGGLDDDIWREDYLQKRLAEFGFDSEESEAVTSFLVDRISSRSIERQRADAIWAERIERQRLSRTDTGLSGRTRANELDAASNRIVADFQRLHERWNRFVAARVTPIVEPGGFTGAVATIRALGSVLWFTATSHWSQALIAGFAILASALILRAAGPLLAIILFLPLAEILATCSWLAIWFLAALFRHTLGGLESLMALGLFTAAPGHVLVASLFDGFRNKVEDAARESVLGSG